MVDDCIYQGTLLRIATLPKSQSNVATDMIGKMAYIADLIGANFQSSIRTEYFHWCQPKA